MSDPTFTEAEATAFATRYGLNLPADQMATLAGKMAEIAKAGLAPRIRLAQADATSFEPEPLFGVSAFDRVFFSYSLSMIPGWSRISATILARVAP